MKNILILMATAALMSACSGGSGSLGGSSAGSSFNPFGPREAKEERLNVVEKNEDGRALLQTIAELKAEPTRTGIILRATSVNNVQGYYDVELVETNNGLPDINGLLAYEIRGYLPAFPVPVNTERSKEVVAATYISGIKLRNVRALRVIAAENQITIRN